MAPAHAKRDHASSNSESDDQNTCNRRDSRKRQRLSSESNRCEVTCAVDDTSPTSVEDEVDALLDGSGDAPFRNDLSLDSDTGELDVDGLLGNEAARLSGLKRIVEKRFRPKTDNIAAENAIIEEVKCINFMCHTHLTVTLGPLINFIIGHNGSGKSAVMTALSLCLGGKATSTNRGQSLKNFIKEGEDSAMLAVKIKNHGSSAFRPEVYGKSIIVERHFNKSGASGFKIKNAKDRVISTKKSELEDIIDAFQLQMDNPMNVLSQDMARQFLNHSSPTDKYKFFIEGTQIAVLDRDYRILEEYLNEIEAKYSIKQQDTKVLAKAMKNAEEKRNAAKNAGRMREQAGLVRRKYAWKQVELEEDKLAAADHDIAAVQAEIEQATAEVQEASKAFDEAQTQLQEAKQTAQQCDEDRIPITERLEAVRARYDKAKDDLQKVLVQQRQIMSEVNGSEAIIRKIEDDIAEEKQRQEDATGGEHGRKLREIDEANMALQEKKAAADGLRRSLLALEQASSEAQASSDAYKATVNQKVEDVKQQEMHIEKIKPGRWQAGFHANLPALLRAVDDETRFRSKPIGPMGRYITLLKPEWSSILERSAGGQLDAFVVTSKQDETILRQLADRSNFKPIRILIGDSRPLDTSNNEPEPNLLTWMRVLKIDNDLVRNQLIIMNGIEQTVLIEDPDEAYNFALGQTRPANVKQVFTMSKDKRNGTRFGWAPSGAGQQSPITILRNTTPRMKIDDQAHINVAMDKLHQYKSDLAHARSEMQARTDASVRAKRAVMTCSKDIKEATHAAQRAEEEWERLRDELEQATPQAGRLENLEHQLKEAEESRDTNRSMAEDAVAERKQIKATQVQIGEQRSEIEHELSEADATRSEAQACVVAIRDRRDSALHAKNQALEAGRVASARMESYQAQWEQQRRDIDDMAGQAGQVGPRPDMSPGDTVDSLLARYQRLQAEIEERARNLGGSEHELEERFAEATTAFKTAQVEMHEMDVAKQVLKNTLKTRQARLVIFKRTIADRARITFTYLLAARKFRGDLRIDHRAKELDLAVEPDITKTGAEGRQTRTLSGGEKSFSTVCLLLSLWDAMGAPTRCLDEFDVFMDSVNREISMKMIIDACRSSSMRQFLFITPQAMGNVSLGQDVKIIKMSDPERNQTTLAF